MYQYFSLYKFQNVATCEKMTQQPRNVSQMNYPVISCHFKSLKQKCKIKKKTRIIKEQFFELSKLPFLMMLWIILTFFKIISPPVHIGK